VNNWATNIKDAASGIATTAVGNVKSWADGAVKWVTGLPGRIPKNSNDWTTSITSAVSTMATNSLATVATMAQGVIDWFAVIPAKAGEKIKNWAKSVTGWFSDMWMKIVGGSIVPDMVTGVVKWFGKMVTDGTALVTQLTGQVVADVGKMGADAIANVSWMSKEMVDKLGKLGIDVTSIAQTISTTFQTKFSEAFRGVLNGSMTFADGLKHILGGMGGVIKELLVQQLASAASKSLSTLGEWAMGVIKQAGLAVVALIKQAYAALVTFFVWAGPAAPVLAGGVIAAAIAGIGALAAQVMGAFNTKATPMATGGIVTGPTFAMMGEGRRREMVLPLERDNVIADSVGQAVFDAMITAQRMNQATQGGDQQEAVFKMDGAIIARALLPHLVREGQRQGLKIVVQGA